MADMNESQSQSQPKALPKTLFIHQSPAMASSSSEPKSDESTTTKLPNGVILDKDGKPCRLCTSAASWRSLTKQAKMQSSSTPPSASSSAQTNANTTPPFMKQSTATPMTTTADMDSRNNNECPPDVEELGRSTWTFLHSLTATYPTKATLEQQTEMRTFLKLFSRLYPCWVCADDFRGWMAEPSGRNEPRLASRSDFGTWMCEAHNEVNRKLGKKEFDCRFWEERWRTGWKDGRCD